MPKRRKGGAKKRVAMSKKSKSLKRSTKSKITLYDLPAELRNTIYELALPQGEILQQRQKLNLMPQHDPTDDHPSTLVTSMPGPGLLGVSRHIREEALGLYYGKNTFQVQNLLSTEWFLDSIGVERVSMITGLVVTSMICFGKYEWLLEYVTERLNTLRNEGKKAILALRKGAILARCCDKHNDLMGVKRLMENPEVVVDGDGDDWRFKLIDQEKAET